MITNQMVNHEHQVRKSKSAQAVDFQLMTRNIKLGQRRGSQTVAWLFQENKPVSRESTPLTFHRDFCVSTIVGDRIKPLKRQVRRLKGGVRPSGFRVQGLFFPCFCFSLFSLFFSGAQNLFFGQGYCTISRNV